MKNFKLTVIIFTLFAFSLLLLCSCSDGSAATADSPPQLSGTDSDLLSAQHEAQIEYYEGLIAELQERLLDEKQNNFIALGECNSIIAELEERIAALKLELDAAKTDTRTESSEDVRESISTSPIEDEPEDRAPTSDTAQPNLPEEIFCASKFQYVIENGGIRLTRYIGNETRVVIPSVIEGFAVTEIGDDAFSHCNIQSVVIPEGVTKIGWFAFAYCPSLSEITIPASVISVGHGAFDGCPDFLVIKCCSDSYAEAFARSWGIISIAQ